MRAGGRLGRVIGAGVAILLLGGATAANLADISAVPPVDAPALARIGDHPVGLARLTMVQPDQADPFGGSARDRTLPLRVWYPAMRRGGGTTYHTALSGEDGRDVAFDLPGLASPDAAAAAGRFPLVILAHGYGNTPEVLSWLGENLASKGYVVVAPAFRDPPISIRTAAAFAGPIARRPLDISFVAREAQARARADAGVFAHADPARTALIGYSMGGYGVLAAGGAPLSPAVAGLSRDILAPYAAGAPRAADLRVPDVKAIVALAPASRLFDTDLWAAPGAGEIAAPTLFIVGSQDRVVGYEAVRLLFAAPAAAPRYLLTLREAGYGIGLVGAPRAMRHRFWDIDWFEDAVWRKDRLLPIETHFITAFLDRYVKGDAAKAAYLDGLVPDSDTGRWPTAPVGRVAAYSPGPPDATVWKGFQPGRAAGMAFETQPRRPETR